MNIIKLLNVLLIKSGYIYFFFAVKPNVFFGVETLVTSCSFSSLEVDFIVPRMQNNICLKSQTMFELLIFTAGGRRPDSTLHLRFGQFVCFGSQRKVFSAGDSRPISLL